MEISDRAYEIAQEIKQIESDLVDPNLPESFKALQRVSLYDLMEEQKSVGTVYVPLSNNRHKMDPKGLLSVIHAEKINDGADFTVKSNETGKEYTFKISRSKFNGVYYSHIYVEKEYQNYEKLGYYNAGAIWKSKKPVKTPAAITIAWLLYKLEEGKFALLNEKIELFHLGYCLRCGKILTDSNSILNGLGPVCRTK
jgi:hypothetical protein